MSDRDRELNLADALRALPLHAPERSAWPELAAQLRESKVESRKSERFRRFVLPTALAAALITVFIFTRHPVVNRMPTPVATIAPSAASSFVNSVKVDGTRLAALQQRSQDLERWLRETDDAAVPLQGQDLVAATEIENLIGLVDVELAAPHEMQDAGLWQRRVGLLEDLSALRYSNFQLAAGGGRVLAASLTN